MHHRDLCNVFLVTDRRLNQAFMTDMSGQDAFVSGEDEPRTEYDEKEGVLGEFLEEASAGGLEGIGDVEEHGEEAAERGRDVWGNRQQRDQVARACFGMNAAATRWRNPEPPPAGTATRTFIREVLPVLARLSSVAEG